MSVDESKHTSRELLSDAIRYWEPRRLIYNGALFLVVAATFIAGWPMSRHALDGMSMLVFFILAVLANVAYCAAYLPDLALQHSSFGEEWRRWRWTLLAVGTLMASALTFLFVATPFGLGQGF